MEVVAEQAPQRARLLDAMIDVVAEKGYAAATVADAVRAARVSRGTFYALFASKEACFIEAYRRNVEVLEARIEAAVHEQDGDWRARLRAGLRAYLERLPGPAPLPGPPGRGAAPGAHLAARHARGRARRPGRARRDAAPVRRPLPPLVRGRPRRARRPRDAVRRRAVHARRRRRPARLRARARGRGGDASRPDRDPA